MFFFRNFANRVPSDAASYPRNINKSTVKTSKPTLGISLKFGAHFAFCLTGCSVLSDLLWRRLWEIMKSWVWGRIF